MEASRDDCHIWRDDITQRLIELGFDEECIIDPVKRQPRGEYQALDTYRAMNKWDNFEELAKRIVSQDLRYVDVSDVLIAHLFPNVKTCGTWDEIFTACLQRKPIFVVMENWREHVSSWLIGRVGHDMMFDSMDEVIRYLELMKSGIAKKPKGWRNINEVHHV
jgi:hypothetical protein